jgi:hypothetical protein
MMHTAFRSHGGALDTKQMTLATAGFAIKTKVTRRAQFLAEMDKVVPNTVRAFAAFALANLYLARRTLLAMAFQGRGHKQEQVPPEPFTGPANALSRIFLEQWVTFPRFVLSGGWRRALRESSRG